MDAAGGRLVDCEITYYQAAGFQLFIMVTWT